MKRLILFFLLAGVAAVSPSYAQSTDSDVQVENAQTDAVEQQRPEMPNLFYRREQRLVLEAVRQGVVSEQDFDLEEFVPVVILEDVLPEDLPIEQQELLTRNQEIYFDSYIVSHKTGKSVLWVNGKPLRLDRDSDVLARDGVLIDEEEGEEGEIPRGLSGGVLQGDDSYSDSSFRMRVGQVLSTDGFVEETLPVVTIKKN